MARSALVADSTRIEPVATDRDVITALDSEASQASLVLRGPDGTEIELPDYLAALMRTVAHILAQGNTVFTAPLETRLTPNEAAELLGVSRPFLLRLIDEGTLPAENLPGSRHRHLRLSDVLEFQARRERRREATRRISEIAEDDDLPY